MEYSRSAAPRTEFPPSTPPPTNQEQSVFSDDTDTYSASTHSRALSPLTDEEISAIHNFIHRHAAGHRARQRRRNSFGKYSRDQHCSRASSISGSYDMHAKILESYLDDEPGYNILGESEDDGDAESHLPMSSSEVETETKSISECSSFGNFGPLDDVCDGDADTVGGQDEVEIPVDHCNRGTFGYYDAPMARNRRYRRGSRGIFAYEYVLSDGETEGLVDSKSWRDRASSDFGDVSVAMETFRKQDNENSLCDNSSHICSAASDYCSFSQNIRPCSSMYYRSSSDYTPRDDEHLVELRTSREPLVPRMLNSDSESDRPLSTSSASMSLTGSTSSESALASGIGLAIIPPEQFAYFDTLAYSPPRRAAVDDGCTDDSPTTLPCASPERRARRSGSEEVLDADFSLSASSDRLQSNLAKVEVESATAVRSPGPTSKGSSPSTSALKPALQIKAYPASAIKGPGPLPSPADSVSTYPPISRIPVRAGGRKGVQFPQTDGKGASHSADEAFVMRRDIVENVVPSFMDMTPDAPTPKQQKRGRLRSLFSRSNLKGAVGRKASGTTMVN